MDEGLTLAAYARYYKIDRKTVYEQIAKGILHPVRVGSRVYISRKERPRGIKPYGDRQRYRI